MKKIFLLITIIALSLTACKKKVDDMEFSGTVVGGCECTGIGSSISEMDWGWFVALEKPEGIGVKFTTDNKTYENVVLLYGTKTRLGTDSKISGRLYMDDKYVLTSAKNTGSKTCNAIRDHNGGKA